MNKNANRPVVSRLKERLSGLVHPTFEVVLTDGSLHRIDSSVPPANGDTDVQFRYVAKTKKAEKAVASMDEYAIAKLYLDGEADIEGSFLSVMAMRKHLSDRHLFLSALRFLRPLIRGQKNWDKTHVPKHYDHGNEFYFAFLDNKFRLYSQALYTSEDESLERAATNKMNYIVDSCRIGNGTKVLDVGAGWGSFACHAAALGADVTMLTISAEQYIYLKSKAEQNQAASAMKTIYESINAYESDEEFDAIVILGVMEHLPNYVDLIARLEKLLKPSGRIYMDFSATRAKYSISTFGHQFVFEGNHTPVYMPGLMSALYKSQLELVSVHNDRHSYFLTLQAWARNLEQRKEQLIDQVGVKTFRLFQLYLWSTAYAMGCDGRLESFRVLAQRTAGRPSAGVGL